MPLAEMYTTVKYHNKFSLQKFSPAINHDLEHSIEERSAGGSHSEYETLAQGLCMSMTINNGQGGYTYAIKRRCHRYNGETCIQLCSVRSLAEKDLQNRRRRWRTIGALHVYAPRPTSDRSTVTHPSIGMKVLWHDDFQTTNGCGPNYCCCFVQT